MDLRDNIKTLVATKPARYWTTSNCPFAKELIQATDWLPQKASLCERAFCVVHNITVPCPCRVCGKTFDRPFKGMNMSVEAYIQAVCGKQCADTLKASITLPRPPCKLCGKPVKARGRLYCSVRCRTNDPEYHTKRKQSIIDSIGVDNPSKCPAIQQKIKQSLENRFGVTNPGCIPSVQQNRLIQTYQSICERWPDISPVFSCDDFKGCTTDKVYSWLCKACNTEFLQNYYNGRKPECPRCNPHNVSEGHNQIVQWLSTLGIRFTINDRSVVVGHELDVWLPDFRVAIEYNGLYWHSETRVGKRYHITKTIACNSHQIQLIHVFSDEWINAPEIVKSTILAKLGLLPNVIYARKCTIVTTTSPVKSKFLTHCHLQGNDRSSVAIGLNYQDTLVGIMTFCRPRIIMGNCAQSNRWEISRMAFALNTHIPGGASKMLEYFCHNYSDQLFTYADRRWCHSIPCYNQFMNFDKCTDPGYWYFKHDHTRWHRYAFAKHTLASKLGVFDPQLTEYQNMRANGYDRVWDCGNFKYST